MRYPVERPYLRFLHGGLSVALRRLFHLIDERWRARRLACRRGRPRPYIRKQTDSDGAGRVPKCPDSRLARQRHGGSRCHEARRDLWLCLDTGRNHPRDLQWQTAPSVFLLQQPIAGGRFHGLQRLENRAYLAQSQGRHYETGGRRQDRRGDSHLIAAHRLGHAHGGKSLQQLQLLPQHYHGARCHFAFGVPGHAFLHRHGVEIRPFPRVVIHG